MAVVVPAGCGSENGDDLQKPNPANSVAPTITVLMPETSVF